MVIGNYEFKPINTDSPSEIRKAIDHYFETCIKESRIPFIEGLCLALGIDSNTFLRWTLEKTERGYEATYGLQFALAELESAALSGEVSPVIYIFLMKRFAGYED